MALIRLEGLSVFGHHGARPYEKEAGQRLEVALEIDPVDDEAEGWCWGEGTSGNLGNGTRDSTDVPVAVRGGHR